MKQIFLIAASVALIGCGHKPTPKATDQVQFNGLGTFSAQGAIDGTASGGSFTGGQLIPSGHDQPKHELAGILGPSGDRSLTVCVGAPCMDTTGTSRRVIDRKTAPTGSIETVPFITSQPEHSEPTYLDHIKSEPPIEVVTDQWPCSPTAIYCYWYEGGIKMIGTRPNSQCMAGGVIYPNGTGYMDSLGAFRQCERGTWKPSATGHSGYSTDDVRKAQKHSYACGRADGMIATATTLERLDIAQSVMDIIAGFGCEQDRDLATH